MSSQKPTISFTEKLIEAERLTNKWLADGNQAEECGNLVKAEKCFSKSQYWLDRYNKLAGNQ